MAHDHNESTGVIEGLIERNERGEWVADFSVDTIGSRVIRCKVDYCPWCGKELK